MFLLRWDGDENPPPLHSPLLRFRRIQLRRDLHRKVLSCCMLQAAELAGLAAALQQQVHLPVQVSLLLLLLPVLTLLLQQRALPLTCPVGLPA